jgi:hypothetical protein
MANPTPEPSKDVLKGLGAYQDTLAGDAASWRQKQSDEIRRLNTMDTEIFGAYDPTTQKRTGGKVNEFDTDAVDALRRLAAQYAARGMLQSGGYGGLKRGAAVQTQKQQGIQRQQLIDPLQQLVDPIRLQQFGLSVQAGPEGGLPVGMQKDFNWLTTNEGQVAESRALEQARNFYLSARKTV